MKFSIAAGIVRFFITNAFETEPIFSFKDDIFNSNNDKLFYGLMEAVFPECGPGLKKLLQTLDTNTKSSELSEIMARLKSQNLSNFSPLDVRYQLKAAFGEYKEFQKLYKINIRKPIVASIAWGYFAKMTNGREVFIKIMQRHVKRDFRSEAAIVEKVVSNLPAVRPFFLELTNSWRDETNWDLERKNTIKGYEMYNDKKPGIKVVKFLHAYPEFDPHVLVLSVAEGKSLAQYLKPESGMSELQATWAVKLMHRLVKRWCEVAIFGEGFFHADLHAGNIIYNFNQTNPENSIFTIIDFGNVHTLDQEDVDNIFVILAGIQSENIWLSLQGLGVSSEPANPEWNLLRKDLESAKANYKRSLLAIRSAKGPYQKLKENDAFTDYMSQFFKSIGKYPSLPMPKNVLNFWRTLVLLSNNIKKLCERITPKTLNKVPRLRLDPVDIIKNYSLKYHKLDGIRRITTNLVGITYRSVKSSLPTMSEVYNACRQKTANDWIELYNDYAKRVEKLPKTVM